MNLSALKGEVVVLDFWATWCESCREQYVLLQKVKQRFRHREDLVFLSLATDEQKQAVKPFLVSEERLGKVYFEGGTLGSIPHYIDSGEPRNRPVRARR